MNELITVEQLPIIRERLKDKAAEIDAKLADVGTMICDENTVKTVKAIRAGFNKEFNEFEEQRKAAKMAVMKPYDEFEEMYKSCISGKFKAADASLKSKIDYVENEIKKEKSEKVKTFFLEYCEAKNVEIPFDAAGLNITLSASEKSLKEKAESFINGVVCDFAMIATHEHEAAILAEYKKDYNATRAVTTVMNRVEMEAAEKRAAETRAEQNRMEMERVAEMEKLAPPPPIITDVTANPEPKKEPLRKARFEAVGTLEQLKALKEKAVEFGIAIKNIKE